MNKPRLLRIAKWLVYLLVIAGIAYTIYRGIIEFQESPISISTFRWQWLPLACLFYFASMLICWVYWHIVLMGLGQDPRWSETFPAFIFGQLGKYFPGKALVVIIRTGLVSGPRVQSAVAATSVFIETLTYMAVGAGVASLLLILFVDVGAWLLLLGSGAIVAAGLPIVPPVFRFIVRVSRLDRLSPKVGAAAQNLKTRTAVIGWIMLPFSWLLVGLSLWAITQLIGVADVPLTQFPRLTACAGLAVVVGFLSMMPGGLGVRELVLVALLEPIDPAFDPAVTLIIAMSLRLCWLMTELILTALLKLLGFARKRKVDRGNKPTTLQGSSASPAADERQTGATTIAHVDDPNARTKSEGNVEQKLTELSSAPNVRPIPLPAI